MSSENQIDYKLINTTINKDNYISSELYQIHLFEQYKLYLELADKTSERRNLVNAFFLTLNSLFLTGLGVAIAYSNQLHFYPKWVIFFMTFVSIVLCYVWSRTLISYRQLNSAKFQIIGQFERSLPASPYWNAEWVNCLNMGKDKRVYWPVSDLENWIPIVFSILYIIGSIWFVVS